MNENELYEVLKKSFDNHIELKLIKPDIYQIFLPYYHDDGDMIDIFMNIKKSEIFLTDFGQTLMRLSYYTDLKNNGRKKIFDTVLSTYSVKLRGEGVLEVKVKNKYEIFVYIMDMISAITKISDISYMKQERVRSMFYEEFDNFMMNEFYKELKVEIKKDFSPEFDKRHSYACPYAILNSKNPIIFFPILNSEKCKESIMTLLYYANNNFSNTSIAMFNDMSEINNKDVGKLVDLSDRPLSTFNKENKHKVINYTKSILV